MVSLRGGGKFWEKIESSNSEKEKTDKNRQEKGKTDQKEVHKSEK